MSNRKWGINNDRVKGNYIDHFECLVCSRMHENIQLKSNGKQPKQHQADLSHYGCPEPFTFTDDGVLLNNKTFKNWKNSSFKFSFEFAYSQLKIFFDYYLPNNILNFTSKDLTDRALKYLYENISNSNGSLDEL